MEPDQEEGKKKGGTCSSGRDGGKKRPTNRWQAQGGMEGGGRKGTAKNFPSKDHIAAHWKGEGRERKRKGRVFLNIKRANDGQGETINKRKKSPTLSVHLPQGRGKEGEKKKLGEALHRLAKNTLLRSARQAGDKKRENRETKKGGGKGKGEGKKKTE